MRPTFAVIVLAALSPCLLSIERITAAPPEAASDEASTQELRFNTENGLFAPLQVTGDACCEKSCCAEKAGDGESASCRDKECCDGKPCCEHSAAAAKDGQGEATAASKPVGIGLRLLWTLPLTAPAHTTGISSTAFPEPWSGTPCASTPCANSACSGSACANSARAASPVAVAATGSVLTESPINPCSAPSKVYYAAIPAAVPSPFDKGGENLTAPLVATPANAATLPLQAPPAPVEQASANVAVPHPISCPTCRAPAVAAIQRPEATQVLFNVDVIEDGSDSLTEFESLQGDVPFLTAESEIILATMRILEKQNLLRRLSNPRLVTTVGQTAVLQVGTESPSENGGESTFNGLRMEVAARELGGGLEIEFKFCDTTSRQCYEVATSLLLAHGQTVVMKTSHPNKIHADGGANGERERPVYVVLTPQVVK